MLNGKCFYNQIAFFQKLEGKIYLISDYFWPGFSFAQPSLNLAILLQMNLRGCIFSFDLIFFLRYFSCNIRLVILYFEQ